MATDSETGSIRLSMCLFMATPICSDAPRQIRGQDSPTLPFVLLNLLRTVLFINIIMRSLIIDQPLEPAKPPISFETDFRQSGEKTNNT